jgi:AcrR family transcriptional regulator
MPDSTTADAVLGEAAIDEAVITEAGREAEAGREGDAGREGETEAGQDAAAGCPRRAPGRPRSARADEAIVEAVLDLLADGTSLEALSMESVALRAGVGKATIYRRWPNKEALVLDALAALKGPLPTVAGESIRDDLLTLLRPLATVRTTRAGRIMPCLIPEIQRNPELAHLYHQMAQPRRQLMRDVLQRGIDSGELRADLDIDSTMAMMVGPMISQSVLNWHPGLDMVKLPEQIVDSLLPGLRAITAR